MASTPSGLLGTPHFHQHQHPHHQQQQQQPSCNSPAQKQQFTAPVQSYALPPQAALNTNSSSQYVTSPLQHGIQSTLPQAPSLQGNITPLSHTSPQIPQPNIDSDSRPLPSNMMHIPGTQMPRPSGAAATSSSYPLPKAEIVHSFVRTTQPKDIVGHTNTQPAYRRAHPEGGFISPVQALTCYLPATYRICNPNFKYESSRNPRRVLTKPSKGVKNDGYDNEDSDYILYVNDILGSEEAGHKYASLYLHESSGIDRQYRNRYLILDVLGQGTFGQVVKCQNLRTQEVVAVKVVKNRTAYFNQSMMEVSVLDLVSSYLPSAPRPTNASDTTSGT
ncbi:dual-specificity tyrosine-(Y)-phosphorylation regulated kinase [Arthrobotrys conoides]|uniref:Dual-specificity tyrosine-(Y)-phosphorylation regulated kinase n=1 Tax=Arthrobotrys conoides TaxID=74498 RepID=A0AAN8S091_9PEZI